MSNLRKKISITAFLALTCINAFAQSPSDSSSNSNSNLLEGTPFEMLGDMSIEDLMNIKITVASKTALTQRESPAIVSVITDNDIKAIGARDMLDVLRLIPGMTFNQDVTGLVSWSMRGNWGNEGKILLMVDGQEMNEIGFASNYFGNRFDISQIKRIEIIRGPGSSIYGGYAELGVVHIITKNAQELNGVQVAGTYGQLSDTYGRRNLSLSAGKEFGDFKITLAGYLSNGQRSNVKYSDLWGNTTSMKGNSNLNNNQFNLGIKYKSLSIRSIYEQYNTTTLLNYDANPGYGIGVNYLTWVNELKYDYKANDKLTITPKFNINQFKPYYVTDQLIAQYEVNFIRTTGGLHLNYDINSNVNFIAGTEYYSDYGKNTVLDDSINNYNGKKSVKYGTFSAYSQTLIKTKFVNLTAGLKYIYHEVFGSAIAPRLGFTKSIGNLHTKLLYNRGFRTPTIDNLKANKNLTPEYTDVVEFEAGYKIGQHLMITGNIYNIIITNPIVYYVPPGTSGLYANFNKSGSRGAEFEFRYQEKNWFIAGNYSFYTSNGINKVDLYEVNNNPSQTLGNPQHKINLYGNFKIGSKFNIGPSLIFISDRYAYNSLINDTTSQQGKLNPTIMFNLNLGYAIIPEKLDIQLMAFNITDQKISYVQPYGSESTPGLAPMPAQPREFVIRLTYKY